MQKRVIVATLLAIAAAGALYFFTQPKPSVGPQHAQVPQGPPPALPPGFPPAYPGATLDSTRTDTIEGGWQRVFSYSAKGKAEEIVAFYRKELAAAGLRIMAEGGGTYGGMLRAQDTAGKRSLSVDVDAPEEAPQQAPKVKVVIVDVP